MAQNSIPRRVPATARLLTAYLGAHYRVYLDDRAWLALEIGQPAPATLAQSLPATPCTLVTAWNPQSVARSREANDAADAALHAELDGLGVPVLRALAGQAHDDGVVPAFGRAGPRRDASEPRSGQDWSEPGWLVGGLDTAATDALARRYGQAGILHWRQGEPVRLRMYRPPPAGHDRHPWVDWVPAPPS